MGIIIKIIIILTHTQSLESNENSNLINFKNLKTLSNNDNSQSNYFIHNYDYTNILTSGYDNDSDDKYDDVILKPYQQQLTILNTLKFSRLLTSSLNEISISYLPYLKVFMLYDVINENLYNQSGNHNSSKRSTRNSTKRYANEYKNFDYDLIRSTIY